MRKLALPGIIALVSTTVVFAQATPTPRTVPQGTVLKMLQGTWVVSTQNGQDATGGPETTITITDNKYLQTSAGSVLERGTFTIDASKKPIALDVSVTEGDEAGSTKVGIIDVTETTMKAKVSSAGGSTTRPTDFTVTDGFVVLTLTKKKTSGDGSGGVSRVPRRP